MTEIYVFIDAEYATCCTAPTITRMCAWLEVSKSGFYEWRSRPESAAARRRAELRLAIGDVFADSDGTYGHRRVAAQLARRGVAAGTELIRLLMRDLGLVACQPRPWRPVTTGQGAAGPIPDLVARDFTADVPGAKMVGDITYIPTWEGWLFLATVIDCATRKVAGWAMDDNYRTPLISSAIGMAARNMVLPPDAVFHSDRGSNYTSAEFAGVLGGLGIRQSVGRTGTCYDNALAKSFNAAVKVERVHRTGRADRVQRVRFTLPAVVLPVRSVDLDDPDAGSGDVPGQARAVAAGALDPHQAHRPEPAQPAQQPGVTRGRGRELLHAEQASDRVKRGSHMGIGVGARATGDRARLYNGHCHLFSSG